MKASQADACPASGKPTISQKKIGSTIKIKCMRKNCSESYFDIHLYYEGVLLIMS